MRNGVVLEADRFLDLFEGPAMARLESGYAEPRLTSETFHRISQGQSTSAEDFTGLPDSDASLVGPPRPRTVGDHEQQSRPHRPEGGDAVASRTRGG